MASIPELMDGRVTLEVECLDRLYLNGYIGPLAISGGWITFLREQLGKPIPSPVVLGQVTEKFREAVKALTEREHRKARIRKFPGQPRVLKTPPNAGTRCESPSIAHPIPC